MLYVFTLLLGAAIGAGVLWLATRRESALITAAAEECRLDASLTFRAAERIMEAVSEQVMPGVANDLAEVRWRHSHQMETHLAQVEQYQEACAREADLTAREKALAPPPAALSVDELFQLITSSVDVSETPAHLLAIYDGEPSHYVSDAMPDKLHAVVDEAWHAPVQHKALVDALLGGTGTMPTVASHPDGPGSGDPTIPGEIEMTQPVPVDVPPSPRPSSPPKVDALVIGRSVRQIMADREAEQFARVAARDTAVAAIKTIAKAGASR